MLKDVVAIKPIKDYQLYLIFEDGKEGIIDLAGMIEFSGVFAALQNPAYFATVHVDQEIGTLCWDSGADIYPLVLYAKVTNPEASLSEICNQLLSKSCPYIT